MRRPHLPRTQRGRRRAVQGLMVACVLALTPMTWMQAAASDRIRTTGDVPATEDDGHIGRG
ncbi:hypothetical protein J0695_38765, partial [Streptomyces beijiangensis]|nr:hypothetical protein [Streptomyces beijiangensis]